MEDLIKIVIVVLFFFGPAIVKILKKTSGTSSQDSKTQALEARIQTAVESSQREVQARRSAQQSKAEGGDAPEPRSGSGQPLVHPAAPAQPRPHQSAAPQPQTRMHLSAQAQRKRSEPKPLVKPHDHPHPLRPQRPAPTASSASARVARPAARSRQASPSRSRSDIGSRRISAPDPAQTPVKARSHGISKKQLRRMIVYKEILGPPRALSGSGLTGPRRF